MSPFWIILELRVMEVVVTMGAIRRAKIQSDHHHQQTNTQLFYRPDALPVAQPTASKHWRSKHWRENRNLQNACLGCDSSSLLVVSFRAASVASLGTLGIFINILGSKLAVNQLIPNVTRENCVTHLWLFMANWMGQSENAKLFQDRVSLITRCCLPSLIASLPVG